MADTTEPVEFMLTTVDNPFDPFTMFDEWYDYDIRLGYHTSALLDRVMKNSNELSEADQESIREAAIDEIVEENVLGVWRKVSRDSIKELPVYNTKTDSQES